MGIKSDTACKVLHLYDSLTLCQRFAQITKKNEKANVTDLFTTQFF